VYTLTPAAAAIPAKNYLTRDTDYGPEQTSYWHGVDFTLNARVRGGLATQVGTSTGRSVVDNCATVTQLDTSVQGFTAATPNGLTGPNPRGCHNVDRFETTLRGLASYTIPRVDVLVSATLRSQPSVQLGGGDANVASAVWNVPNAEILAALGHLPAGSVLTGNTPIQITDSDHRVYANERRTQIDMRFAKIIRVGRTRSDIGVDLNNLLNTNYATGYSTTYTYSAGNTANGGTWGNPTSIYTPRFVRINYTLNF
jgi:hypothetical protein